ncbi:DUF6207 family protein [Streptomyces chartreusis]|uniref:DUF6207 family protein n=1 Tax=Streptomyces chartreusis TaxID=1969 RepID=UPI0035D97047
MAEPGLFVVEVAAAGDKTAFAFQEALAARWATATADGTMRSPGEPGVRLRNAARPPVTPHPLPNREVRIPAAGVHLGGRPGLPDEAQAVVVFAHGSGSSRHSPRNRYVASVLNRTGLGTLLLDLHTEDEEGDRVGVFDILMLAQ